MTQGLATGFVFPFNNKEHGIIKNVRSNSQSAPFPPFLNISYQIAFTSENPYEWTVKTRLLIVTSTGAIQMWQDDEVKWTREEALSNIAVAEFVEVPEKITSKASQRGTAESFIARIRRQIAEAQVFSFLAWTADCG